MENTENMTTPPEQWESLLKAKKAAPYARVLVVDDNLTNLEIVKGLLSPYQMQVDCVDSGKKAIDAIMDDSIIYDMIFMDIMMPEMDGVETVKHIREIGSDYTKNIPVIAVTANTVAGHEEKLLSNGFQVFIPKPIDVNKLDDTVFRWIHNRNKEKPIENSGSGSESETSTHDGSTHFLQFEGINIPALNIKKGIRQFGGDISSYIKVLRSYAINTRTVLKVLSNFNEEKIHDYEIVIHGIKGSSASICADELAVLGKKLEEAAKAKDINYIKENNNIFINNAELLISQLNKMLTGIDSENPKPQKDKPDKELLEKLKNACDAYEMDEVDAAIDEITKYNYSSDDGLVNWLSENIEQMNFSEIVEKLSLP